MLTNLLFFNSILSAALFVGVALSRPFSRDLGFVIVFLIVNVIALVRWDVGADWDGHYRMFFDLQDPALREILGLVRPDLFLYRILSDLFAHHPNGYIFVIHFYFLLMSAVVLYVLRREKLLLWGVFFFLCFAFFRSIDRIRQFAAFAVFLLAVRHVVSGNFLKYVGLVLIGSLFHASLLFMLPMYYLGRLRIGARTVLLISIVVVVLFYGRVADLLVGVIERVPIYGAVYGDEPDFGRHDYNTGITTMIFFIVFLYTNFFSRAHYALKNLVYFGVWTHVVFAGWLNLGRIADFLLLISIVTFAKDMQIHIAERRLSRALPILFYAIVTFQGYVMTPSNEYQTIFSVNAKSGVLAPDT